MAWWKFWKSDRSAAQREDPPQPQPQPKPKPQADLPPDLQALVGKLRSERSWEQTAAAEKLGASGDPRVVPHLVRLFEDGSATVRESGVKAILAVGPQVAYDAFLAALGDYAWEARLTAASGLGQLGDVRAIEALETAMRQESSEFVRKEARYTLDSLRAKRDAARGAK